MNVIEKIDLNDVDYVVLAKEQYFKDIDSFKFVSHYLPFKKVNKKTYSAKYENGSDKVTILINVKTNALYINNTLATIEDFLHLVDTAANIYEQVALILDIHFENYITEIHYLNGETKQFDNNFVSDLSVLSFSHK